MLPGATDGVRGPFVMVMTYFNPNLPVDQLRDTLVARGRIQVRDFFAPHVADALHQALRSVEWNLSYRDDKGDALLTGVQLRQLDVGQRTALSASIHGVAARGFQFRIVVQQFARIALGDGHQGRLAFQIGDAEPGQARLGGADQSVGSVVG